MNLIGLIIAALQLLVTVAALAHEVRRDKDASKKERER